MTQEVEIYRNEMCIGFFLRTVFEMQILHAILNPALAGNARFLHDDHRGYFTSLHIRKSSLFHIFGEVLKGS